MTRREEHAEVLDLAGALEGAAEVAGVAHDVVLLLHALGVALPGKKEREVRRERRPGDFFC